MGLSVTAYKDLEITHTDAYDAEGNRFGSVELVFTKHPSFPDQFDKLVEHAGYKGVEFDGPEYPYSAHGRWREELAKLAGYAMTGGRYPHSESCWNGEIGPFYELINFSDCEGSIGPLTSLKLLGDFVRYDVQAKVIGGDFYKNYIKWHKSFEHASHNGAVDFG